MRMQVRLFQVHGHELIRRPPAGDMKKSKNEARMFARRACTCKHGHEPERGQGGDVSGSTDAVYLPVACFQTESRQGSKCTRVRNLYNSHTRQVLGKTRCPMKANIQRYTVQASEGRCIP